MTPKEKAKELVYKYLQIDFKELASQIDISNAKECSLISVNELIEETYFTDGYYDRQEYWQEVKQEIEKL